MGRVAELYEERDQDFFGYYEGGKSMSIVTFRNILLCIAVAFVCYVGGDILSVLIGLQ